MTTYLDTPYKGSEAYKCVMGSTPDELLNRRPYAVSAIAYHTSQGNPGQIEFFKSDLALIDELLIKSAKQLGRAAFKRGVTCAPSLDSAVMAWIAKLSTRDFSNHAIICQIMEAWSKGWNAANAAKPSDQ